MAYDDDERSGEPSLLDRIERLANDPPRGPGQVQRQIGVQLSQRTERSTPAYVNYYAEISRGHLASVELRTPASSEATGGQLLRIRVRSGECVRTADVAERFGETSEIEIPSPHHPSKVPLYHTYDRPWGQLSFGFERQDPKCLSEVILDVTEESSD